MKTYLSVDIGASGGRHILGFTENGKLRLRELYRFPNGAEMKDGRLCWPLAALKEHLLRGIAAAKEYAPESVSIDTWGVDYVLLDKKDDLLDDAVAYRDGRTKGMEKRIDFQALFTRAGIAAQPFNTVYQLMATPKSILNAARTFLMMPDYLHFLLSGVKANEYTDASTTSLLNAAARSWDDEILSLAGIPRAMFSAPLLMPGTRLGRFTKAVRAAVGFDSAIVLPASHDTGSAYMAVPARDDRAVYLSSGTWSLLGVESAVPYLGEKSREAGFTNEGGYGGTYRFLKNIMGLWIIQCVQKEQGAARTFGEIAEMAQAAASFPGRFDANAARFLAPKSMCGEILNAMKEAGQPLPTTDAELYAAVFRSLAACYAASIRELSAVTGKTYTSLNIVGGGSQNDTLNQWTADAAGIPVFAGPTEGTALGSILSQMIASGEVPDLTAARRMINDSFEIKAYQPS